MVFKRCLICDKFKFGMSDCCRQCSKIKNAIEQIDELDILAVIVLTIIIFIIICTVSIFIYLLLPIILFICTYFFLPVTILIKSRVSAIVLIVFLAVLDK